MPVNYRVISNKKYVWDGKTYDNEGDALSAASTYKSDRFEAQLIQEEGKHFIYTRRESVTSPTAS